LVFVLKAIEASTMQMCLNSDFASHPHMLPAWRIVARSWLGPWGMRMSLVSLNGALMLQSRRWHLHDLRAASNPEQDVVP